METKPFGQKYIEFMFSFQKLFRKNWNKPAVKVWRRRHPPHYYQHTTISCICVSYAGLEFYHVNISIFLLLAKIRRTKMAHHRVYDRIFNNFFKKLKIQKSLKSLFSFYRKYSFEFSSQCLLASNDPSLYES